MQDVLIRGRETALALALALLPPAATALDLGDIEIRSAIGEKLDARIPVRPREGEWFHASCLSLAPPGAGAGLPALAGGVLSVERRRDATHLQVRTATPVDEPALSFGVRSACAGEPRPVGRDFLVLLDPRRESKPVTQASARAGAAPRAAAGQALAAPTRARPPAPLPAPPSRAVELAPMGAATPSPAARPESRFVLKLSSGSMDLSRTREFDDKSRAVLRERLRLLDSDDQVAAMLSMRDNLLRLEARVAELQLKLAAMPPALAQAPAPASPKPAAVPVPPARVEAPAAPAGSDPPVPAATGMQGAPAGRAAQPSAPAKVSAPVAPPVNVAPKPAPEAQGLLEQVSALPGAIALALGAALALLAAAWWRLRRRRSDAAGREGSDVSEGETVLMAAVPEPTARMPAPIEVALPIEVAAPTAARAPADLPAERVEEGTASLRRRYIEERFPEIRSRAIVLDDPGSVVKGGRLFYEDGAIPRAVELLRFAIEDRPDEMRPWLALFEIYRLELLAGEYAELARHFAARHGSSVQWAKVQAFGREIDPANPLYAESPPKPLETIGPREARQFAAATVDPIAENWLEAPMDFENEVFATELRRSLMARAAIDERDLTPNPMPALRSVEMFSVG